MCKHYPLTFTPEQIENLKKCEEFYEQMEELGLTNKEEYSVFEMPIKERRLFDCCLPVAQS